MIDNAADGVYGVGDGVVGGGGEGRWGLPVLRLLPSLSFASSWGYDFNFHCCCGKDLVTNNFRIMIKFLCG